MGTDIHFVFQKKCYTTKRIHPKGNKQRNLRFVLKNKRNRKKRVRTVERWKTLETRYQGNRHYQLFAVLAGVRNGFGFAGIPYGEVIIPIAQERGLPEDFDAEYLGDHSMTWLMASEYLNWLKKKFTVLRTGVISRQTYETWDKKTPPLSYAGFVSGQNVITVKDNEVEKSLKPNWSHIQIEWYSLLNEEFEYFTTEIKRLYELYGDFRLVLGFDS